MRGRRGSGRRTLLAALAARAGRTLAVVDATRLAHDPRAAVPLLQQELERAFIAGCLPCLAGIDELAYAEPAAQLALRAMLRRLALPVVFRLGPGARPPLDPGHLELELAALDGAQRQQLWAELAGRVGLTARDTQRIASRFRVTPGLAMTAADRVLTAAPAPAARATALAGALHQELASGFGGIADRVLRLATWEQLVLPPESLDSVREFVSRVRHTHQVYDTWGFDRIMSSARGLVAMFSGSPGTGKTMVAGVIARELGLDLYRVDVSRLVSKWIGETEKNLAEVFDAAEDGQAMLLFDEADSLFGKRTEVRSSNDRYANLEVNYLLQRLDAFQGLAILTTNFGRSVDAAFNRRLSLRLTFPFPDEEMRERLWRAHLPPELPVAEDLDLRAVARKYQLSGGYIRNAALRGAFLAAGEAQQLAQRHLERAVRMEYNDIGRLAEGAALE